MDYKELIERTKCPDSVRGCNCLGLYDFSCKKCREQTMKDCVTAIETLLAERESAGWISVNDRLPEQYELVLIAYEDGFVNIGYLGHPGGRGDFSSASVGLLAFLKCRQSEVTHWMPLPAPPDRQQTEKE